MALGVGAYFGEGAYLKKYGIPKPKQKIYQQKVFLNDLYTKQDFLGYENGREIGIFQRGLPQFSPKMLHLQILLFFGKIGQEKVFENILYRK